MITKITNTVPHAFQDATYGQNVRVLNKTKKLPLGEVYRDTVTGNLWNVKLSQPAGSGK